jgi:hypothetical protein
MIAMACKMEMNAIKMKQSLFIFAGNLSRSGMRHLKPIFIYITVESGLSYFVCIPLDLLRL